MAADPNYDLQGAIDVLFPGVTLQRQLLDAAAQRYAANGFAPLASADVAPILAAANTLDQGGSTLTPTAPGAYPAVLPSFPKGLKRFADSNPSPFDGWAIDNEQAEK